MYSAPFHGKYVARLTATMLRIDIRGGQKRNEREKKRDQIERKREIVCVREREREREGERVCVRKRKREKKSR